MRGKGRSDGFVAGRFLVCPSHVPCQVWQSQKKLIIFPQNSPILPILGVLTVCELAVRREHSFQHPQNGLSGAARSWGAQKRAGGGFWGVIFSVLGDGDAA